MKQGPDPYPNLCLFRFRSGYLVGYVGKYVRQKVPLVLFIFYATAI